MRILEWVGILANGLLRKSGTKESKNGALQMGHSSLVVNKEGGNR